MANEEHVEILKQGVEVWNRWREEDPDIQPDLRGANLNWARRRWANLSGANLRGADLIWADLRGADLTGADLSEADLSGADLRGANLTGTGLIGADLIWADLIWADLREADLREANLTGAHLTGAKLRGAKLSGAKLRGTYLERADLRGADLRGAHLDGTRLNGADLRGVNLQNAYLRVVDLSGADLGRAVVVFTTFVIVDLSAVKGLETIEHQGPSFIDIYTIYRSGGKIPEAFLRGCGVPDNFIAYMGSLTGKAFEYYSCFISYSSIDDDFAKRLHTDLQQNNVRCWFAPEDMKIGDKIRRRIDQSIRLHDKLLVVLSEHSINSAWVEKEVETAFEEESKRNQTVLFPVRLDETVMETDQAWAADIRRTRHIGDFCRWKDHDSYQQAFDRLLRDLKASEA